MDEDSQQEPESPRMAPPTTPSPAPSTPTPTPTPQPVVVVVQPVIPTTTALTVMLPSTQSAIVQSVIPSIKTEIAIVPGSTLTSTTTTTATTTTTTTPIAVVIQSTTPNQSQPSFITSPVSIPNIPTIQSNAGLLTPISLTTNQNLPLQINSLTPLTGAGGSITAGISNQMVTQQNIIPIGVNSILSGTGTGIVTDLSQNMSNNGIISTPTRGDPQSKVKSGVLRFGPAPTESEINRMPGEFNF